MIAIYARVSTTEQAKDGYSIDEQIDRLKKYCEAHGRKDVVEYIDAGYTGTNMKRPSLRKMLDDIESKKIDKVIVWKLDRLSRSQKDTLHIIEDVILKNGADFESMNERFDTGTSFGHAMIGILSVFAQLEREQIRERMSMGKAGRAKAGKWHGGGNDPIGYHYENGELHVDEYEAQQVRFIYESFLSGASLRQIEKDLAKIDFKPRGILLHNITIKRILTSPIYVGKIVFKGEINEGIHTPIITNEMFNNSCQRMKQLESQRHRSKSNDTLLQGIIFCKHCGARYACTAHSSDAGKKYKYYACYSRRKVCLKMVVDPNCKNKTYRVDVLDNLILDEIKKLSLDPTAIDAICKKSGRNDKEIDAEIKTYNERLKKIENQKSRLFDLYQIGNIDIDEIQKRLNAKEEESKKLKDKINALTAHTSDLKPQDAKDIISKYKNALNGQITSNTRALIDALIEKIEIDNEDIIIHWRFV